MNSNYMDNNKYRNRVTHTIGFLNVHPPGGLVVWPDGSTSRIGERRRGHTLINGSNKEQGTFVSWPETTNYRMRA